MPRSPPACPARVDEISPAAGSEFDAPPPDNAAGNLVKIARRIPLKISIDPDRAHAARPSPGMPVAIAMDTSAAVQ